MGAIRPPVPGCGGVQEFVSGTTLDRFEPADLEQAQPDIPESLESGAPVADALVVVSSAFGRRE
jgi:hypothetical protein